MNNRLRKARLDYDITQTELAKKTGISRATIIAIEKGKRKRPSDETMIKLAEFLGKDVGEIFYTPVVRQVLQNKGGGAKRG